MGTSSSTLNLDQNIKDKYLKPGITETELERIYQEYQNILIDEQNELVCKSKLKKTNYITKTEYDAIQHGLIQEYLNQMNQNNDQDIQLDNDQEVYDFQKQLENSKRDLIQELYLSKKKEIDNFPKLEAKEGSTCLLCTCSSSKQDEKDYVKLSFDDFYKLMSLKIIQQKRSSSNNTVFEAKTTSVSCLLWPSFTESQPTNQKSSAQQPENEENILEQEQLNEKQEEFNQEEQLPEVVSQNEDMFNYQDDSPYYQQRQHEQQMQLQKEGNGIINIQQEQ